MEEIIAKIKAATKTSQPWKRGEAVKQPFFEWWNGKWQRCTPAKSQASTQSADLKTFSVVSWNIDFMRSYTNERMDKALSYLQTYVGGLTTPGFIMLNEMLESDLELMQAKPWIRDGYMMTDINNQFWESGYYGTCVLIPKDVAVADVFRVHYDDTAMERDGLFIDAYMSTVKIRLCCTHLESLVADPPKRSNQLRQAAEWMHKVDGSVLGGDLNAIQPFDKNLHSDNNLKDAYLETGGIEDAEAGMTWGQMASTHERKRFGLSRMDKFMFCGALHVKHFETFGLDVVVDDPEIVRNLMKLGNLEKPWVTDHLAIRADFEVIPATAGKL